MSAPTVTSDQAEKYRDRIAEARRALPPADAGLELWAFDGADEFFCSLLPNFRAMAPSFASRTPMRTDTDQWV